MDKMYKLVYIVMVILVVSVILSIALSPVYNVWAKELSGKADLKESEWSRQIAVEEAQARLDSSKLDAQAEVERAYGVAEANLIIGESLQNNTAYLHYLWILGLHDKYTDTIYIPTEANLPILEAGRGFN